MERERRGRERVGGREKKYKGQKAHTHSLLSDDTALEENLDKTRQSGKNWERLKVRHPGGENKDKLLTAPGFPASPAPEPRRPTEWCPTFSEAQCWRIECEIQNKTKQNTEKQTKHV